MDFSIAAGVRSTLETLEKVSSLEGVEREYTAFISYIAENAGALYDCKRLVRRMVNDALATLEMRFQNYNEDYKNGTTLHVIKELGKILWDRDDENNCQNVFGLLQDEIKIHIVKRFPFCDYLDVYKSNSNPVVNKALFVFGTIFGCRDKFIYQKVLPAWINAQKIPLKVVSYQPFETLHTRLVLPWLQHIDLYQCVAPHAEHLSKLRFHSNVKTLRISDSNLCYSKNAKLFDHKQWAQLSDLTFQDCTITKSIVGELLNLNCLNSLVFHSVSFASDDDFSDLKKMTQLKKLCFISCLIDYDVTTAVKEFTSLQEFVLHEGFRNNRFTHGGFTNLRTLTNLKRLSIHNCFSLWKNGFSVLSLLTKLESLNVNGCCFMQEWNFAPVRGLTNLIELHASIPLRAHTNISDEYLTNLQNLRSLSITATQNNTVQSLTALKSLQILKINMQTANKDKDFSALAKIGSLEELNIEACHLTVRRLNDICRLAHLRILKITGDEPSLFSCELHSSLENLTLLEDLQSLSLTGLPLERCSFKAWFKFG